MADEARGGEVTLKTAWIGVDEHEPHLANQFICQHDEEMFYITFGLVAPPVLLGTQEEIETQAAALRFVPIEPRARVSVTPQRMRELIDVLRRNLSKYDDRHGEG